MPTYEYECESCKTRFEHRQSMTDEPITECPRCHGRVRRLISGGAGFILKDPGPGNTGRHGHDCALERTGRTCCGRDERCGDSKCHQG